MPHKMSRTPEHEVCAVNVAVPTVLFESLRADEDPEILVQWFGESQVCELEGMQFKFNVPSSISDTCWFEQPKEFQVIMLDQAKNWPQAEARSMIIRSCGGDPEMWVLWVTSTLYGSDRAPACFMVKMNVLLAENTCGIITPKHYLDLSVIERANEIWNGR